MNQINPATMKFYFFIIITLLSVECFAQQSVDYYGQGDDQKKVECTCPYEKKTTFLGDLWHYGVVATARSLWTGIVKPTAVSSAAGALQSTYSSEPVVGAVAGASTGVAVSKAHRSRNRRSHVKNVNTEPVCTCNPCAYHGARSFTPRHQPQ